MTGKRQGICAWCGSTFDTPSPKGPIGRYCSRAHRQAAYRQRSQTATTPGDVVAAPSAVEALLDELARVLATPGEEATFTVVAVAGDLVAATGRPLPADGGEPDGRSLGAIGQRRRPTPWTGRRLARPANITQRFYERTWDHDWGWQVVVRPAARHRDIPAGGAAKPLWLRRHRAVDDPDWRTRYDWADRWDVPDSNALQRLATDLLADALDHDRNAPFRSWNHAPHIARHFAGDVLYRRLRDTAWRLSRREILDWLDLHSYLEPIT